MELNSNNIPELQSPFEQLREVDADGKEWWNSRKLARVMGYGKCPILLEKFEYLRTNGLVR